MATRSRLRAGFSTPAVLHGSGHGEHSTPGSSPREGSTSSQLAKQLRRGPRDQVRQRGRISWRTELFQEVLLRLRKWTIYQRRQMRHRRLAQEIIRSASVAEINEVFLNIDCNRFWKYLDKDTFDLLRTRLPDLGVPARAALLTGLIQTKAVLAPWWINWVRDMFLETKGEELTLLKNMVDSGGDYHNLYKHIYKDLRVLPQSVSARKAILEHIRAEGLKTRQAREASFYKRPRIKIVSDIDDTLWSSGGHYPAGTDEMYPKGVVYPGVLALFRELIHDSSTWHHSHSIEQLSARCKTLCDACDSEAPMPDRGVASHIIASRSLNASMDAMTSPLFAGHAGPIPCSPPPIRPSNLSGPGGSGALDSNWIDSIGTGTSTSSRAEAPGSRLVHSPMRRIGSEPAAISSALPDEEEKEDVVWCNVPGFFERHAVNEGDSLEAVRSMVARNLMVPERAVGQINLDFSEMDQHFNTDCALMFLSARPGIPRTRGYMERRVYKRFADLYKNNQLFAMPTLLPGSLSAGFKAICMQIREGFSKRLPLSKVTSAWIPVGFQKMIAFCNFATLYPEYDFVFFGDNGQADVYLCDRLMWEPPVEDAVDVELSQPSLGCIPLSRSSLSNSSILTAFIHKVHNDDNTLRSTFLSSSRDSCGECGSRLRTFETYVGAAVEAHASGLLSLRGLRAVGAEAIEDFYRLLGRSLMRGTFATWRRKQAPAARMALNADLLEANKLLSEETRLPLIMPITEWQQGLQPPTSPPRGMQHVPSWSPGLAVGQSYAGMYASSSGPGAIHHQKNAHSMV